MFSTKTYTALRPQASISSDICCRLKNIQRLYWTNHSIEPFSFSLYFSAIVDIQEISMNPYKTSYLQNMEPKPCFAATSEFPFVGVQLHSIVGTVL